MFLCKSQKYACQGQAREPELMNETGKPSLGFLMLFTSSFGKEE